MSCWICLKHVLVRSSFSHRHHLSVLVLLWWSTEADHPLLLPHLASQCNSRPQSPRILRPITSGQGSHNSHGNQFVSWPTSQPLQPNNACLHMLTTLFLVTNTISGFFIGSFSFFIRKLLCGLHQKLRNEVECNDGCQLFPSYSWEAWDKPFILRRDCHGQDIPA